ncbi:hypothetical protein PAAL109150_08775 [Paenibacillus alkaliterrae]
MKDYAGLILQIGIEPNNNQGIRISAALVSASQLYRDDPDILQMLHFVQLLRFK